MSVVLGVGKINDNVENSLRLIAPYFNNNKLIVDITIFSYNYTNLLQISAIVLRGSIARSSYYSSSIIAKMVMLHPVIVVLLTLSALLSSGERNEVMHC